MIKKRYKIDRKISKNISCGEVVTCVCEVNGDFLFIKSEARNWELPTGRVEKNESPKEAAERELYEETSITPVDSEKIAEIKWETKEKEILQHVFLMNKSQGEMMASGSDAKNIKLSQSPIKPCSFGETGYKMFKTVLDSVK